MDDTLLRDCLVGVVQALILHYAAQDPGYGLALMATLHQHGYELSLGTLDPVRHGLQAAGQLEREDHVIAANVWGDWSVTERGAVAPTEARSYPRTRRGGARRSRAPAPAR